MKTDSNGMGRPNDNSATFYDILLEKMQAHTPETPSTESVKTESKASVLEENSWFFTLNIDLPRRFQTPEKPLYKSENRAIRQEKPQTTSAQPVRQEATFLVADLSLAAQLALKPLGLNFESQSGLIRISDVKKAFRRLARQHHPDLQPHAQVERFHELKTLSELVLAELQSLARKTA